MDNALQPLVEMNDWAWKWFKGTLIELGPDEVDWRPLPQANNINAIVRHLRIEGEWHTDCIERGVLMPAETTPELERSIDAVAMDFEKNLKELEEFYARFLAQLRKMESDGLKQYTALAYKSWPGDIPEHMLGYHQAMHLAGHAAQISTIRNLYKKTRGEPARFFPDNPSYPK